MATYRPQIKNSDGTFTELPIDAETLAGHAVETSGVSSNTTTLPTTAQVVAYAATKSHTHSYLPLSGGTMTGPITLSNTYLIGGAIDSHPENGGTVYAYYINDLIGLLTRGGTCTVTNTTQGTAVSVNGIANIFDGSPSYADFRLTTSSDVIEILIDISSMSGATAYSYTTQFGIGFGNSYWSPGDVKFEIGYKTSSGTVWVTRYSVTNTHKGVHNFSSSGPNDKESTIQSDGSTVLYGTSSNTWNLIKITLGNFYHTSPRIAQIWTENYGSQGLAANFLQRIGGSTYGNIYPYKTNTGTLGTSSYMYNNIYATTFTENGTALSSKYSSLTGSTSLTTCSQGTFGNAATYTVETTVANDSKLPTGSAVKTYVDNAISSAITTALSTSV